MPKLYPSTRYIYWPAPFNVTESVDLFGSFDGISRIALRFPATEGVKVTVSVHVSLVARVGQDAGAKVKSSGLSPVFVIAPNMRSVTPLFVIVSVLLVVLKRGTFPKLKLLGFLAILGGFALALSRTMVRVFLGSLDVIWSWAWRVS